MQEELKEMIKITSEREVIIIKENDALKQANKKLIGFGEFREKILQEEL